MTEEEYRRAQVELERERIDLERSRLKTDSRVTSRHFAAILGAAISVAGLAVSASQIWVARVQKEKELELQQRQFQQEQQARTEESIRKANLEAVRLVIEQREAIFSADVARRDLLIEQLEVVLPSNIAQRLFARLSLSRQTQAFAAAEQRVRARYVTISVPAAKYSRASNVEVGGGLAQYGTDILHNGPPYNSQENSVEYDILVEASGSYELWVQYAANEARPVQISMNGFVVTSSGLSASTGGWFAANLSWRREGVVSTVEGRNVLRLYRDSPIPHIRMIELRPILYPPSTGG